MACVQPSVLLCIAGHPYWTEGYGVMYFASTQKPTASTLSSLLEQFLAGQLGQQ